MSCKGVSGCAETVRELEGGGQMNLEVREDGLVDLDDGVPFLAGLMLSFLLSLGLWMAVWWIGLLIRY
jgi:hypothetical protein